jgi:hypothetical protein
MTYGRSTGSAPRSWGRERGRPLSTAPGSPHYFFFCFSFWGFFPSRKALQDKAVPETNLGPSYLIAVILESVGSRVFAAALSISLCYWQTEWARAFCRSPQQIEEERHIAISLTDILISEYRTVLSHRNVLPVGLKASSGLLAGGQPCSNQAGCSKVCLAWHSLEL